jgi:cytochrome c biogenesis protein CcdA
MKRFIAVSITIFLFAAAGSAEPAATAPLELYFFGSNTCGQCLQIKNDLLYPIEKEVGPDKLKIHFHDTENEESFALMIGLEKHFNMAENSPQELFFPDTVILGYDDIMALGRDKIMEYVNNPNRPRTIGLGGAPEGNLDDALRERFSQFTIGAIILAAIADSINPCAIATMIFLVSFLATQKRKRSEVLMTGLSFTLAVFLTYLLLGLGAFKVITLLDQYYWVSRGIKWMAVTLAGVIGIICFVDAFRYKKTGDAKEITLQLPKSVKTRIHKVITTNMKGSRLVIGAFITGFLVTLLEAVCTGQVYLPTIVLMTRSSDGGLQLTGWLLLIMYNFIFVVPLLSVMIAAYYGMKWNTLSKMMQKNLTLMKILLGVAMVGLAVFLAVA